MLSKDGLAAKAPSDVESMDVEEDDETEGFVRTSIVEEDEDDADADKAGEAGMSTKHALQKLRKGIVKIRYAPQPAVCQVLTISSDRQEGGCVCGKRKRDRFKGSKELHR